MNLNAENFKLKWLYRVFHDEDLPSECRGPLRRDLREHPEEGLEPSQLVPHSHLRGNQVPPYCALPGEQSE